MNISPTLRERLSATRFRDVRWSAATASTNTDVLELGRAGEAEGIVVVADEQTAGRGRRGRSWEAPAASSLLVSVLLRPPAAVAALVTAALALAAAAAVEELAPLEGHEIGIKWPNDIVATEVGAGEPDRKLAGILAEAEWPAGADISAGWRDPGPHERVLVAAGIGLNVHWPLQGDDGPVDGRAVSLDVLTGRRTDRTELLVELLEQLELTYGSLVDRGPTEVLREWRRRCVTIGRRVRVDLGAEDVDGRAIEITDDGHLVVETLEGERRVLAVGDVVHVLL